MGNIRCFVLMSASLRVLHTFFEDTTNTQMTKNKEYKNDTTNTKLIRPKYHAKKRQIKNYKKHAHARLLYFWKSLMSSVYFN